MDFFVVYLASKRFVIVKKDWVQNAVVGKPSKVFVSPNPDAVANFNNKVTFYLNTTVDACYEAFICKAFGKYKVSKIFKSPHFHNGTFFRSI